MFYVYLLKGIKCPDHFYIGFTEALKARLRARNAGDSTHAATLAPWELVSYHAFNDKRKAQECEYYLKTGSGKAFASKRLW